MGLIILLHLDAPSLAPCLIAYILPYICENIISARGLRCIRQVSEVLNLKLSFVLKSFKNFPEKICPVLERGYLFIEKDKRFRGNYFSNLAFRNFSIFFTKTTNPKDLKVLYNLIRFGVRFWCQKKCRIVAFCIDNFLEECGKQGSIHDYESCALTS